MMTENVLTFVYRRYELEKVVKYIQYFRTKYNKRSDIASFNYFNTMSVGLLFSILICTNILKSFRHVLISSNETNAYLNYKNTLLKRDTELRAELENTYNTIIMFLSFEL